jgi:DNA polymerase elongation subunit (family B)
MTNNYYTNVSCLGSNILFRGVKDGRRVKYKVAYTPTLFLKSNKKTNFKSLEGFNLEPVKFDSIREARNFIQDYNKVEGFKIYGNDRYEYAYIADTFKDDINWKLEELSIALIDIEVGSENGFPDPYKATEPITAIGIKYMNGNMIVYGCGDYNNYRDDVTYLKCKDELDLCRKFLQDWQENCPDAISGWNIRFFDIPYLVNRISNLLGEDEMRKLSPWNIINTKKITKINRELDVYDILGIPTLDYIELYRWYAPAGKSQESYKLDHIASVELGENKLSYDEYENLHDLYRLNYQKFIDYNIKDVELVLKLENKLKLIELGLTLAYDTKTNYEDIFAQTRMWDALIYNYLLDKDIIVPPKVVKNKNAAFEGAYVKEPQVGAHDWVASFDLNSLYPHLMMMYNISPETLIEPKDYDSTMSEILSQNISVEKLLNKQVDTSKLNGTTLTPNGQFFRTDIQGFLPKMLEEMYESRKKFKKMMLTAKQQYENETDESKKEEIKNRISRYDNLQLAKKVSLNSAYGALGSQYFRFYDLRQALAVTQAGQLSIRWIEKKLNEYMNKLLKTEGKDYVIASDTDSIYLRLGELVEKVYNSGQKVPRSTEKIIEFMDKVCESKLQPFIDESYQELATYVSAYGQKMQMKREALSDRGIWTAKKRYILNVHNNEGVQYKEPKMKVMGLEMVKSSTPAAIREKLKQAIHIILNGKESDIHEFIEEFRNSFKTLPPEEVSFPRGLNGLKDYFDAATLYKKGTPIHVKGALLYNNRLLALKLDKKYPKIQDGEKIKFTYLKQPNPLKDMVVSYPTRLPPEFGLHEYVDYDTQFEKAFLEPVKIILDCMDWTTEKNNSLESFFS